MRILLSSARPSVDKVITQLAVELGRDHEVAMLANHSLSSKLHNHAGLRVYYLPALAQVYRLRPHPAMRRLGRSNPENVLYRNIPVWEFTHLNRLRTVMRGGKVAPRVFIDTSVAQIEGLHAILEDFQPHVVSVWNGAVFTPRSLAALARDAGAEVLYFERGLLPDSLVIDPMGVNAKSVLCTDAWEEIAATEPTDSQRQMIRRYLKEMTSGGRSIVKQPDAKSPEEIYDMLGLPPHAQIVLVPAQIDWDSNIVFHSPNYKTNADVLTEVRTALADQKDKYIVFKPHPEDHTVTDYSGILGDRGRVVSDVNLHSLIDAAALVAVRNSTTGLEAVAHWKPVVVLGRSIY
jgi:hypothetical protein